ncbi:unnamed protein product [Peniophora sp. CBMAI 1063]|nr:unnamed protein product [Peniophora sp. CBMAI 1063]
MAPGSRSTTGGPPTIIDHELRVNEPMDTFRTLWGEALHNVKSARWLSMEQRMLGCNSVEDVCMVLEETIEKLEHSRSGSKRWRELRDKYLKPIVQALLVFSDAIAEIAASFPVVPGGKAIFTALGILLAATDGVEQRRVALIELFKELEFFNKNLLVRLAKPAELGQASKISVIAIMACILDILLIATRLFPPSV